MWCKIEKEERERERERERREKEIKKKDFSPLETTEVNNEMKNILWFIGGMFRYGFEYIWMMQRNSCDCNGGDVPFTYIHANIAVTVVATTACR
jgi:hypothetical protein